MVTLIVEEIDEVANLPFETTWKAIVFKQHPIFSSFDVSVQSFLRFEDGTEHHEHDPIVGLLASQPTPLRYDKTHCR